MPDEEIKQADTANEVGASVPSSAVKQKSTKKNAKKHKSLTGIVRREVSGSRIVGLFEKSGHLGEDKENSFFVRLFSSFGIGKRLIRPVKKAFSGEIEHSAILNGVSNLLSFLLDVQLRVYGAFLFSFGFFSALISFVTGIILSGEALNFDGLISGGVIVILGIVLIIGKTKTLSEALCSSSIFSFVLFEFLGLYRETMESRGGTRRGTALFGFLAGMVMSIFTLWIRDYALILLVLALICILLIMYMPEAGAVAMVALLPFIGTKYLIVFMIITCMSFLVKLMRGQRTPRPTVIDGAVAVYAILVLLGGIFSVSQTSLRPALVFVCFIFGYFIVSNFLCTRRWLIRLSYSVCFAVASEAVIGVAEYLFGWAEAKWFDTDFFSGISGRVVATLENPNVLGEFLIMLLPFIAVWIFMAKKNKGRVSAAVFTAVSIVCLVFTWSRGAWIGFAVGAVILLVAMSEKALIPILIAAAALPFSKFWMPEAIYQRIASIGNLADSSSAYRLSVWKGSLKLALDNILTGIGVGTGAFSSVYPSYAYSGCETAQHSHNLYLQITLELGIPALLLFLFIIYMLFARARAAVKADNGHAPQIKLILIASLTGLVSILVQGMTDYIWYNYRVFLLFWIVAGIASGASKYMIFNDKRIREQHAMNPEAAEVDLVYPSDERSL